MQQNAELASCAATTKSCALLQQGGKPLLQLHDQAAGAAIELASIADGEPLRSGADALHAVLFAARIHQHTAASAFRQRLLCLLHRAAACMQAQG